MSKNPNPQEKRRRNKRWAYLRNTGRPSLVEGPEVEAAKAWLVSLHERGMSMRAIGEQAGMPSSTISAIVRDDRSRMMRSTLDRVQTIRYKEDEVRGARVPHIGAQRRLRGLWADGFPMGWIVETMGFNDSQTRRILHGGSEYTHADLARKIAVMYEKMDGVTAADAGCSRHGMAYARNKAVRFGYEPRHCWDAETIDDPQAYPEWTGHCGTERGYDIHRRDKTVVTERWNQSRGEWQPMYICDECNMARHLMRTWPELGYLMNLRHRGRGTYERGQKDY